jgi:hypothetical protein
MDKFFELQLVFFDFGNKHLVFLVNHTEEANEEKQNNNIWEKRKPILVYM